MKKALFFLLLLVVALAIVPLFLPKTMYVEEEYVFDKDINQVYEKFYDLEEFNKFDLWTDGDKAVDIEYSDPSAGLDAYYTWEGTSGEIESGKMEITEFKLNQFINYEITFGELKGNTSEVIFQELPDNKTKVIWSFTSAETSYPFQIFNVFMKSSVKDKLHQGLSNLDELLQKESVTDNQNPFQIKNTIAQRLYGVLQSTTIDVEEIETAKAETIGFVRSYLVETQDITLEDLNSPVIYWKQYDAEKNKALFYCGYFLHQEVHQSDDVEMIEILGGRVLTTRHKGSYENIPNTYDAMRSYAESIGIELSSESYDQFLNLEDDVKTEAELVTEINIPILD